MTAPQEPRYCRLAEVRHRLKISQAELARRAGLTRQSVNLIEHGKVVPSVLAALALAEALGCAVGDLFQAPASTRPLRVSLAGPPARADERMHLAVVRDRWIGIPCAAAVGDAGGFGSADASLIALENRTASVRPLVSRERLKNNLAIAGCDPALGTLRDGWNHEAGRLLWLDRPTRASMDALAKGEVHVAGIHWPDEEAERKALAALPMEVVVVRFARWEQGWMLRRGNPSGFSGVDSLVSEKIRFLNRPSGSGSRLMLDGLLKAARVKPAAISGYRQEAPNHFSGARAVRDGAADVALGLRAVAACNDLDFVPVQEVAFNLLIPRDLIGFAPVVRLLEVLQTSAFRRQLESLPGYAAGDTGSLLPPLSA